MLGPGGVRRWRLLVALTFAVVLAGGARAQAPERRAPTVGTRHMVVAPNPLAAAAGREVLRQGGSATDAVIAMQMVLTVVEPHVSGIGGGGFLVHYDASRRRIETFDGRETGPAESPGPPEGISFAEAQIGGAAVGVPGLVRMLGLAHDANGRLPWTRLFEPSIALARDGFPVSVRLARAIAADRDLLRFPAARAYFFDANGEAHREGAQISNEPLAETLRMLANGGPAAFYSGAIARDIVAAVREAPVHPGHMSRNDLANYAGVARPPLCGAYRSFMICGMRPPASGGIAVVQTLGILANFDLQRLPPNGGDAVHLLAEATRLVLADRQRYLAISNPAEIPVEGLIDPAYLAARAHLIDLHHRRPVGPGVPAGASTLELPTVPEAPELPATSFVAAVDGAGNAAALAAGLDTVFGARILVRGFMLNARLAENVRIGDGRDNSRARPLTAMAPTIITDGDGRLVAVIGAPGGSRIIPFIARTLVATLDGGFDIQAAINLPLVVATGGQIILEADTPLADTIPALRHMGHEVSLARFTSGLAGITVTRRENATQLTGGVDPRRDGESLGD